jgi:hypothetical protein
MSTGPRSLRSRLRRLLPGATPDEQSGGSEADAGTDPNLASSRATGGRHRYLGGDRGSVTGTGDTDEFVGQIAGDDLGYADETGAERRAAGGEPTARTTGHDDRESEAHPS